MSASGATPRSERRRLRVDTETMSLEKRAELHKYPPGLRRISHNARTRLGAPPDGYCPPKM